MTVFDLSSWHRNANSRTVYPKVPGVYALFLNNGFSIPHATTDELGLIYVGFGQGMRGLAARCHFRGKTAGHSPRRSLAARLADELGLRPKFIEKPSGATTFTLEKPSEQLLDRWMDRSLSVATMPCDNPTLYERELIIHWEPPLNCDKKSCALNAQQFLVLDRRKRFKALAASLAAKA